jgi:hypothetical protein
MREIAEERQPQEWMQFVAAPWLVARREVAQIYTWMKTAGTPPGGLEQP